MKWLLIFFPVFVYSSSAISQSFSVVDYQKALWMTARMYGGQRSGENNWLVYNHLPSGVNSGLRGKCFIEDKDTDGCDLSGGWHDAGDHVKFGHTQFYSAYMVLKGYAEFPTGYDDYYSYEYFGYKNSGNWTWEGNGHDPNFIPDVLDEIKHATDYFIKCAKNSNTFYYQVGQGDPDHSNWVTAVKMQTLAQAQGGQSRVVYKNPNDASMASFCGATLALMSRVYKRFDSNYANTCLQHAKYAYDYAKAHPGVAGTGDGGFYGPNSNWKDDYATMCAELFWATGNELYKTEALSFSVGSSTSSDIYGSGYGFDYANNGDIALYNLALLGKPNAKTLLNNIVVSYKANVNSSGLFNGGNQTWGTLRYNANTSLIVALWQKLEGTDNSVDEFIYKNIDYILGDNSANLSFIVGFGDLYPRYPHHRNIYLRDDNPFGVIEIPEKNRQFGFLIGGARNPSDFNDNRMNYQQSEGGIDYNACLVGVLAYIVSRTSPVDTSKFGHPVPNLGPSKTLCGVSNITLDTQIPVDGKKTFEWTKDGIQIQAPSTTANTISINSPGTYVCILDSAGKWSTRGKIDITNTLPQPDLGGDKVLCDPPTIVLDLKYSGQGVNYKWLRNGSVLEGEQSVVLAALLPGVYTGIISAFGCSDVSDEIIITTELLNASHDTICEPGQVQLAVSGSQGPFEWYDNEVRGTVLSNGDSYSPFVSTTTTYYVKDLSSAVATAGPLSSSGYLAGGENAGLVGVLFNAARPFVITDITATPYVYYCGANTKLKLTFQLKQGGAVIATYTSDEVPCVGNQYTPPFQQFYTFHFSTPIEIPSAGSYELLRYTPGDQLPWFQTGVDYSAIDVPGLMDITGDSRTDKLNSFPGIYDIKIRAGSGCGRTPVVAKVGCNITGVLDDTVNSYKVFPNPSNHEFYFSSDKDASVKVYDSFGNLIIEKVNSTSFAFGDFFQPGIYFVQIFTDKKSEKSIKLIKQ
ncbi:MAG: glycoside hydrolase family 9 protein [Cytophagaceae bacterium]